MQIERDLQAAKERAITNGDSPFVPYLCEHGFIVEMFKSCPECEAEMNRRGREWEEQRYRARLMEEGDEQDE